MRAVYEGKQVMVEWKPIVDLLVSNFLTRPNRELMVHYTDTFITPVNSGHRVWMFYVINPWLERFDRILHAYKESGLRDAWMPQAFAFFSQKYVAEYDMEPLPKHEDPEDFTKMGLGDLFGLFVCFGLFIAASVVVMAVELVVSRALKMLALDHLQTRIAEIIIL